MEKLSKLISGILGWLCIIITTGLAVIVSFQVITRLLGLSFVWTEELARFLLIWLTFFGCALAIKNANHLSVKFFVNMVPAKARLAVGVLVHLTMIFFFGILIVYGIKLSALSMSTPSSTLQWPMGLVYAVLPFCALICVFFVVRQLAAFAKTGGKRL